jgi:parallel beta-helix repeat protein
MTTITVTGTSATSSPTSGIQEAIDALGDGGGLVHLPTGEYPLRQSIRLKSRVTLRGEGGATILQLPSPRVYLLANDLIQGDHILRLRHGDDLVPGDQLCILEPRGHRWYHCRYVVVESVVADGACTTRTIQGDPSFEYLVKHHASAVAAFPAILISEVADVSIETLVVQGPGSGPAVIAGMIMTEEFMHMAVSVHRSQRCRLRDLTVRHAVTDGICVGGGATDVSVTGCIVEHCGGIGLHTGGGIKAAQFLHNISRHNHSGFLFCQGNRHVVCAHNLVHHNLTDGIWGLDAQDQACIVSENICHHNGWHGIEAEASVNNMIRGNLCRNNSTQQAGRYAGIYLRNASGTVVQGNLCYDDQEHPTQTRHVVNEDPNGSNLIGDNMEIPR